MLCYKVNLRLDFYRMWKSLQMQKLQFFGGIT